MPSRITYNSINVDLVREWTRFSASNLVKGITRQAQSGIQQTVTFFNQDIIIAERERLTAQEVIELEQFYDFAKDGSTFSFERDRNLGTYISFEGKSLNTNDGTAGTFTRALTTDSSYYLDPSTELMTVINTVDIARFPEGKYGGGVLIEGARTNLNDRPSDFDPGTATWVASNMTVSANTTETLDPAGGNNADKLTATAASGRIEFTTSTAVADTTISVWLKSDSGTVAGTLNIIGTSGGSLNTAISVTPTWQIFSFNNSAGGLSGNLIYRIQITTDTEIMYAWGCNFEVGTDQLFPSQVIGAVSTSSITRNAESLTYPTVDVVNQNKGMISLWVKPEWVFDEHAIVAFFTINSTATDNTFMSYLVLANGNHELRYFRGDNTRIEIAGASTFTQNVWSHVVITYDSTVANGLNLYVDGVLSSASPTTNDPFNPADVEDTLFIGTSTSGTTFHGFCVYDDFMIRKDVFNAAQVRSLFNFGRGLGIRKNRWSSVKLKNPDFNPVQGVGNKYSFRLELEEVLS